MRGPHLLYADRLLPARPFVGALMVLLPVLLVTAGHFILFGALLIALRFLLSLLCIALLLFAWIVAWFGHGSLLI